MTYGQNASRSYALIFTYFYFFSFFLFIYLSIYLFIYFLLYDGFGYILVLSVIATSYSTLVNAGSIMLCIIIRS